MPRTRQEPAGTPVPFSSCVLGNRLADSPTKVRRYVLK